MGVPENDIVHGELIPHLFRREFGKITCVLVRMFGFDRIDEAEDIASAAFLAALERWPYTGIPPNPGAWLYRVARNKALNQLRRDALFRRKVMELSAVNHGLNEEPDLDLSPAQLLDSQLRMLFAICHPALPVESQIGLALRLLCGFGVEEIASAFLTNKETINKRLYRAKEQLSANTAAREEIQRTQVDDRFTADRLERVLHTLYLLFNEGYYSETNDALIREELCADTMRLTQLLLAHPACNLPAVHALLALMCFHASRLGARKNDNGEMILFADQDERKWDHRLITDGAFHLQLAATGNQLSRYHLEATIAYWHTRKNDSAEKWESILMMYNYLLQVAYTPVAALNRAFAIAKLRGNQAGIIEAEKLHLEKNHFYHFLLGLLYAPSDPSRSAEHLESAKRLAKSVTDVNTISVHIQKVQHQHAGR